MALFVTVLLVSNIASSAKIVSWGVTLPVLNLPLAFDAGTLLFPISYIFGDILTEVYGYARGRRVIWTGFAMALLMSGTLWIVGRLPGAEIWEASVGQEAYDAVLGGVITGGIVVASLVAYFAGEFSNSYVLARMKVWTQGRHLWSRTIGSTLVGELVTRCFRGDRQRSGCLSMEPRCDVDREQLHLQGGHRGAVHAGDVSGGGYGQTARGRGLLRLQHGFQPVSYRGLRYPSRLRIVTRLCASWMGQERAPLSGECAMVEV
jgi:uncharacterized integral membrane protein (TIGR00697 family)